MRDEDSSRPRRSLPWIARGAVLATLPWLTSCKGTDLDFSKPVTPPSSQSISITSTGFSPSVVFVSPGGSVTFTNKDNGSHQVASDQCPELNGPVLAPGARFVARMTGVSGRSCEFHDESRIGVTGFTGSVFVCTQETLFGCS